MPQVDGYLDEFSAYGLHMTYIAYDLHTVGNSYLEINTQIS